MDTSEKLKAYFSEEHLFKKQIQELRKILLSTDLTETFKWSVPTYTWNTKNVLSLGKFKSHYGIWFFNGVFLTDPDSLLRNAQEKKTKAMRQWRFTSKDTINATLVLAYCQEAISNEKKGSRYSAPKPNKSVHLEIPNLLALAFLKNNLAKESFKNLTSYKQKEYITYIKDAKQEKTKTSRIQKILPLIEKGVGLQDKYRKK